MGEEKRNGLTIAAYVAVCILWGTTYLAMRIAATRFPPELFAGMRFFTAGAIVTLFAAARRYPFPSSWADVFKSAVPGIFMLMGSNGLVMWAEQWVHSGITSLLLATTPLFVSLLETFIFRETKIRLSGWICLLVGFLGIAMLIASGAGIGSIDVKGGSIVLIAALLWSLGSIYSKKAKPSGHFAAQIGIQMLAAGVGLTAIGLLTGEASRVKIESQALLALAYLIVFGSIVGYSSNMFVLRRWPASVATTSAYINPVVAVILGVLILGETINLKMVLFMVITLGSVVMLHIMKYGFLSKVTGLLTGRNNKATGAASGDGRV